MPRDRPNPIAAIALALAFAAAARATAADRPNIVYILADDLGYGDVHAFHPEGKIPTPRLDRLAAEGRKFTDAHSGSAVCTPTRYGLLTGRSSWRTRLANGVLNGYSPPLIAADRPTVASFLREQGYRTGAFGKWHLGWDWATDEGERLGDADGPAKRQADRVDYEQPIARGPNAAGFGAFFGISASLDMPPYVFVRDVRVTALPTAERTYIRKGPAAPTFEAEDVLPTIVRESVAFLDDAANDRETPFFLYLPLASPHTPIVPIAPFLGKSGLGDYADFVMQTDAAVGAILDALDRLGLARDTLVIFTSDNGCSPSAGIDALEKQGHRPSGPFRGAKADIYEGGHRVPFLARWPGHIPAGTACDATIGLTDLFATTAAILDDDLPDDAAEDSVNILPHLLGEDDARPREAIVHHSIDGSFAIRKGRWKLALCPGSGGWSFPRPGKDPTDGLPPSQLFDLDADIAEAKNLAAERPEVVAELTALLDRYVAEGRGTPGPRRANDRTVSIRKPSK